MARSRHGIGGFNVSYLALLFPNRAIDARGRDCRRVRPRCRGRFVGAGERRELLAELAEDRLAGESDLRLRRPGLHVEQAVVLEQLERPVDHVPTEAAVRIRVEVAELPLFVLDELLQLPVSLWRRIALPCDD